MSEILTYVYAAILDVLGYRQRLEKDRKTNIPYKMVGDVREKQIRLSLGSHSRTFKSRIICPQSVVR